MDGRRPLSLAWVFAGNEQWTGDQEAAGPLLIYDSDLAVRPLCTPSEGESNQRKTVGSLTVTHPQ